jgi:hypothetical protein
MLAVRTPSEALFLFPGASKTGSFRRSLQGRIIRRYAPHPSHLLGAALRAFVAAARRRHSVPEHDSRDHASGRFIFFKNAL